VGGLALIRVLAASLVGRGLRGRYRLRLWLPTPLEYPPHIVIKLLAGPVLAIAFPVVLCRPVVEAITFLIVIPHACRGYSQIFLDQSFQVHRLTASLFPGHRPQTDHQSARLITRKFYGNRFRVALVVLFSLLFLCAGEFKLQVQRAG
jgi:hypothetical protein